MNRPTHRPRLLDRAFSGSRRNGGRLPGDTTPQVHSPQEQRFRSEREPDHIGDGFVGVGAVIRLLMTNGGTNMRTWIRVIWTAAILIALAWPLLFWGKAASLDRESRQQPLLYNSMDRHEILW